MNMRSRVLSLGLGAAAVVALVAIWHGMGHSTSARREALGESGRHVPQVAVEGTAGVARSQPVDAKPARQPVPEEPNRPEAAFGRVVVRVSQAGIGPLPGIALLADRVAIGVSDAAGEVRAELPLGDRVIACEGKTIPDHLMGVMLPDERPPEGYSIPAGYFWPVVRVDAMHEVRLEIVLQSKTRMIGMVSRSGGAGIANCEVMLQGVGDGLSNVRFHGRTDSRGAFEFVGAAPGNYLVHAFTATPNMPPEQRIEPIPIPQPVALEAGASLVLAPLVAGDQRATFFGRVVDQRGRAVPGIEVVAYPHDPEGYRYWNLGTVVWSAVSQSDGGFFVKSPPAAMNIQVHGDGARLPVGAPLRIRYPLPPIVAQGVVGEVVQLGDITLELVDCLEVQVHVIDNVDAVKRLDPGLERVVAADVFYVPTAQVEDRRAWRRVAMQGGVGVIAVDAPGPDLTVVVERPQFRPLYRQVSGAPGKSEIRVTYP